MASKMKKQDASNVGKNLADQIIAGRKVALARRAKALATYRATLKPKGRRVAGTKTLVAIETKGHLIAAGDSWFDYPGELLSHDDVLELLEQAGYTVESTAHAGDPIEAMAYGGTGQLFKLAKCFEKVAARGATPMAVLLSGGGDDIAGAEFGMLLNNANSAIAGWNDEVVDGVINERIDAAYRMMIDVVAKLSQHYVGKTLPILIHGYDYAVPDGRNFGGLPFFPGPWLQPGFSEKQFSELAKNTAMIQDLIDRFNTMLERLASEFDCVHYVDLRKTLSNTLAGRGYQKWWANELHPTVSGFKAVTAKFEEALEKL